VLASGGIDSTACLDYYLQLGYETEGIFIDYGHPANNPEYDHVCRMCGNLGIPLHRVEFRGGHPNTVGEIRGRNALLVIAALVARPSLSGIIALGIHAGVPYYDCGKRFVKLMGTLVSDYTDGTVQFDAPFIELSKPEIVNYCRTRGVALDLTYSCEAGTMPPCQSCPSCRDRQVLGIV